MKTLQKWKIALIAILAFAPLVFGMAVEPSDWIQHNSSAWLVVRLGIVLPLSIVLSLITYYGVNVKTAFDNENLPASLRDVNALAWTGWWIFCFQIMATFYVADWCATGF